MDEMGRKQMWRFRIDPRPVQYVFNLRCSRNALKTLESVRMADMFDIPDNVDREMACAERGSDGECGVELATVLMEPVFVCLVSPVSGAILHDSS